MLSMNENGEQLYYLCAERGMIVGIHGFRRKIFISIHGKEKMEMREV